MILAAAVFATPLQAGEAFRFDNVVSRAEHLAGSPFESPTGQVPKWLLEINYDQWRDIRFRPEESLWRDRKLPFEAQFFHAGLFYDRAVTVNVVDADGVHPAAFNPSQFDYGQNKFASQVPQDLGYAGFRLHYPINKAAYKDELIVFLGATYFRALGKGQAFGLSARGLAIDTALPSGEEFPYFREFWLVQPSRTADSMSLYALLDSPRVTGAYHFIVYPGTQTIVDVEAKLFLRKPVEKLGISPLTSMFLHGENTVTPAQDYRPEVHDSDGVLMASSTGEWIWRPLDNPERLRVSAFQMKNPKGFGLIQRDRDFDHYQDLETHAEVRPSVWVAPRGDWGEGHVELVEIPTKHDTNDNIVAFWVPAKKPEPGQPIDFSYRLHWYAEDSTRPTGGRTVATRRDSGTVEDGVRFVVDFASKKLASLPAETVLQGVVTVGGDTQLLDQVVVANPDTGGRRLVFQLRPNGNDPIELRAFLQRGDEALTETWTYVLDP